MTDAPAPPREAVPAVANPRSYGAMWRMAESEFVRADVRHRMLVDRFVTDPSPVIRRAIAESQHARDAFMAICRLLQCVSEQPAIKAQIAEVFAQERRVASDQAGDAEAAE